ncbi:MAG: HD domain-containing protein [Pseudomonadota bacterium]
MKLISSQRLEAERELFSHPLAFHGECTRGRRHPEAPDEIRTPFERDAHRILHARPFRRLRRKTRVFFTPENDHITTRMDHSLYVATISRTICRALRLNDDLAYAISLGHDIGHAPFGHSGERVLEELLNRRRAADDQLEYSHEAQSLRVLDLLSHDPSRPFHGLNLCYEVRDGIRCHCGESTEQHITPRSPTEDSDPAEFTGRRTLPITVEGCVVRMADRVAYLGRDYEDAQTALGRELPPLPAEVTRALGADNRQIINALVRDLIAWNQLHPDQVGFSPAISEAALALRAFNYEHIYLHPRLEAYRHKADKLLERIYDELVTCLRATPPERWAEAGPEAPEHLRLLAHFLRGVAYQPLPSPARLAVDWLSLMTDQFAIGVFSSIVMPQPLV